MSRLRSTLRALEALAGGNLRGSSSGRGRRGTGAVLCAVAVAFTIAFAGFGVDSARAWEINPFYLLPLTASPSMTQAGVIRISMSISPSKITMKLPRTVIQNRVIVGTRTM